MQNEPQKNSSTTAQLLSALPKEEHFFGNDYLNLDNNISELKKNLSDFFTTESLMLVVCLVRKLSNDWFENSSWEKINFLLNARTADRWPKVIKFSRDENTNDFTFHCQFKLASEYRRTQLIEATKSLGNDFIVLEDGSCLLKNLGSHLACDDQKQLIFGPSQNTRAAVKRLINELIKNRPDFPRNWQFPDPSDFQEKPLAPNFNKIFTLLHGEKHYFLPTISDESFGKRCPTLIHKEDITNVRSVDPFLKKDDTGPFFLIAIIATLCGITLDNLSLETIRSLLEGPFFVLPQRVTLVQPDAFTFHIKFKLPFFSESYQNEMNQFINEINSTYLDYSFLFDCDTRIGYLLGLKTEILSSQKAFDSFKQAIENIIGIAQEKRYNWAGFVSEEPEARNARLPSSK